MIYFDNVATTKPIKEVLDIYNKVNEECWYNASSSHRAGIKASNLFEKASKLVLKTIKATNKKVIFTSGATEANNMAIYGVCERYKNQNKRIITTKVEHPSVLNCFKDLENYFDVVYLDITSDGIIDLDELKQAINNDTIFISIMWVNNIIGAVNNITEIIKIIKQFPKIKFHIDAVQGIGKIPTNFEIDDVDLLTMSSHKIHGLKGCGMLIMNQKLNLTTFTEGSNQQIIKSGTIDLPSSVACAKALEIAVKKIDEEYFQVLEFKKFLYNELIKIPNIKINGKIENYSPYILNFSYLGVNSETFLHYLEENDIYVSISSACNAKLIKPERTVLALTKDESLAKSSIRISFSSDNTLDEVKILIKK